MRCSVYSFICNYIPKSSTTRVNVIPFLLWRYNPGVIGTGSYPNGWRFSLSAVCAIIFAWTSLYINFYNLTYINPLICLSMRLYSSITS